MITRSQVQYTEAHLTKIADNAALYAALSSATHLADIAEDAACTLIPGYRLIRLDNREKAGGAELEIALIDDIGLSVVYYIRGTTTDVNGHPAIKIWGWRSYVSSHFEMLRAVIQKVFFNYLIERYDILISNDSLGEGEFFWFRQMSSAIALGHDVYLHKAFTTQLQRITSQAELDGYSNQYWSNISDQASHEALISRAKLDTY